MSNSWPLDEGVVCVDPATVESLGRHWEEGWNNLDLETITAPFAPGIVFSSPFVPRIGRDPTVTRIEGYEAVRRYVADSFVRATPGIRYTLDASYSGIDRVVLVYTVHRPDGTDRAGADTMRLDAAGRVIEWHSHYPFETG